MQKSNVSFFSYFLTINQAPHRDKMVKTLLIQMLYGALFAIITLLLNNFNIIMLLIGFMAFFAAVPLQWVRSAKPNLTSLVPLSQRRRTVYNFLSIPAMFVYTMLISGLIIVLVWLLSGLGAAAISGDAAMILSIFRLYTDGISNAFADGYAVALFIFTLLYIFGAGMVYSHTDSKKYRNITAAALFVFGLIGAEVLLQVAMRYSGDSSSLKVAGYAGMYIKYFPLPWLAILLSAMVSLAVLGFGIYLIIQKNKPKNY